MPKGKGKMTTSEWVTLAVAKHGTKYDYSDSEYLGSIYKILIRCLLHGEFSQNARSHLDGRGCPTCGKEQSAAKQTISSEAWIEKAKAVHGNKYDYSKTVYVHSLKDVEIFCRLHGPFFQRAQNHIDGSGCQQCGSLVDRECSGPREKVTTESWIARAQEKHNQTYTYDNSTYTDSTTKITITCRLHGDFSMMPGNHVNGSGCVLCGRLSAAAIKRHTPEWFTDEATKIHKAPIYDYSRVTYVDVDTLVEILCPVHGSFNQTPYNHLQGQRCPGCANRVRYTTETFIAAAVRIHGNRYNYSETKYFLAHEYVTVTCVIHGDFKQKAYAHVAGQGCGRCGQCANSSKAQIQWLEWMAIRYGIVIEHAENTGEFRIPGSRYLADGFCRSTNTVWEYHGSHWHADPREYFPQHYLKRLKAYAREVYERTMVKEAYIQKKGYELVSMWEVDWKKIIAGVKLIQKTWRQSKRA